MAGAAANHGRERLDMTTQLFLFTMAFAAALGLAWRGELLTLSGIAALLGTVAAGATFDWGWFSSLCSTGGAFLAVCIFGGYSLLFVAPAIATAMVLCGVKSMWLHRTDDSARRR